MVKDIDAFHRPFFIGIAGAGMSAIAQYLQHIGKKVSGSDRYFQPNEYNKIKAQLEKQGIECFLQDGRGITPEVDLIVVSTAIEDSVLEVQKAKEMGIPIIKRSELLALITQSKKTIAVGGTSGKSTTVAMIYHILENAGFSPSIITGAGLTSLIEKGEIGNAKVGKTQWLVIEADESDGSIVQYCPEIGVLLNIDKDHQEIEELVEIFSTFQANTKTDFLVNLSNELVVKNFSDYSLSFGFENPEAKYNITDFNQEGFLISFKINGVSFEMKSVGRHTAENAVAAVAVAHRIGVSLELCAEILSHYKGIYRRHQILGEKKSVVWIDDYAHNPAKCAASIRACQPLAKGKLWAWFQPHGYGPTRFLKDDFVKEISQALRSEDTILMSEIYYAGGTANKNISANDLIKEIEKNNKNAIFIENRQNVLDFFKKEVKEGDVVLLMGARDPSLESFAKEIFDNF